MNRTKILSCFILMISTSFNLFSQEIKLSPEEKYQERLQKHRQIEQSKIDKDSINTKVNSEKLIPKSIIIIAEDPTFPVFYDTGNPELDIEDYTARKMKWIAENEEAYKKLQISSPYSEKQKKEIESKESLIKQEYEK